MSDQVGYQNVGFLMMWLNFVLILTIGIHQTGWNRSINLLSGTKVSFLGFRYRMMISPMTSLAHTLTTHKLVNGMFLCDSEKSYFSKHISFIIVTCYSIIFPIFTILLRW